MKIDDGTGSGRKAKVDSRHRVATTAVSAEQQHEISHENNEAFQLSATNSIATTEQSLLLIKNTHSRDMIITFLRMEVASAATSGEDAYFNIKVGGNYASGGTAVNPINMYVGSAVTATGLFYDNSGSVIVDNGAFVQIDRSYMNDVIYNKHGALILPKNSCVLISHKGSSVAGTAYCRVSFYYDEEA